MRFNNQRTSFFLQTNINTKTIKTIIHSKKNPIDIQNRKPKRKRHHRHEKKNTKTGTSSKSTLVTCCWERPRPNRCPVHIIITFIIQEGIVPGPRLIMSPTSTPLTNWGGVGKNKTKPIVKRKKPKQKRKKTEPTELWRPRGEPVCLSTKLLKIGRGIPTNCATCGHPEPDGLSHKPGFSGAHDGRLNLVALVIDRWKLRDVSIRRGDSRILDLWWASLFRIWKRSKSNVENRWMWIFVGVEYCMSLCGWSYCVVIIGRSALRLKRIIVNDLLLRYPRYFCFRYTTVIILM